MPSLAAERMRRHRQRQRNGLRCLVIELHEAEVDVLVQREFLKAEMRNDSSAIIEALYDYLYHTMGSGCDA
jgi:IS30 family transposase